MGKKTEKLAKWLHGMSVASAASDMHASPKGDARELPEEAPTENECRAFLDGLTVAFCMASMTAGGAFEPAGRLAEDVGLAVGAWMKLREDRGEGACDGQD